MKQRNEKGTTRTALEVKNLTVSYGTKPVLLDISFKAPKGSMIGIIGPNGSGKSTLLKSILGFIEPDFGEVKIFGAPLSEAKGRVAYVPQRGAVDWDFPITVEQVAMMGRYREIPWWKDPGREDRELVSRSLEMVKMEDFRKRQIGQLSGGQQQRVFMARALTQGADLLLLDEPFAGVDAATERAILDVLGEAKRKGQTLLVVHHDLATAAEYFDLIILLKQRLYAFGPPETVFEPHLLSEVYEGKLSSFSNLLRRETAR